MYRIKEPVRARATDFVETCSSAVSTRPIVGGSLLVGGGSGVEQGVGRY